MSIKELSVEECIEQIEATSVGLPRDGHDHDEEYSHHEQRKIIHKVDRRLITGLGLLFGVSLMDRTNLGNMSIAGYALQVYQSPHPQANQLIVLISPKACRRICTSSTGHVM
jgi:hypothetical protein